MLEERIRGGIERYYDEVFEMAMYLTEHPELSCEEVESSRFVIEFLEEHGYEVTEPYAGMPYSFVAVDRDRKDDTGPKAAFLCEYDALPEVGHACGHSFSCGISVLGALALKSAFRDLPIRIDLIGTPAEELGGGKCIMTENGGFDDYEFAAMVHLSNTDNTHFNVLSCNDRFFTFHGKGAHASAAPEEGINALNAARLFMEGMDMWRQHITKDCQFHGIVANGGTSPNIVPEEVSLDYYFRAESIKKLWNLNKIAERCAEGAAMAVGASVNYKQRYPDYAEIYWDDTMEMVTREAFEDMGRTPDITSKLGGSSDVGNVSLKIPVFHLMLDVTDGNKETALHSRSFEQVLHTESARRGLRDGAGIIAELANKLGNAPELLSKIQSAHKEYRKFTETR